MPLKLLQRHGSPNWYIRGTIRGISVDESTGLSDRRAAEEVFALRSAEIVTQSVHGSAAVKTFAEAALSYMEAGGERLHLAPIIKLIGMASLNRIGQEQIEEVARKLKPGASPATINRHIYTPISAVLNHAARKKWCSKPVIARPKQPRGRVRWITPGEADRLISAAAPHLKPLVIFLLCTGARLSEALYLNWREVDLARSHVSFNDTKNGDRRGVPLHSRAVAALSALPYRSGAVFRVEASQWLPLDKKWRHGRPYADRGNKGGGQVSTAWASMLRGAQITDFTPHDCRHTWATWHYAANRDLIALMRLGGWKSEAMVLRYAHVNVDNFASSVARIWQESGDVQEVTTTKPLRGNG